MCGRRSSAAFYTRGRRRATNAWGCRIDGPRPVRKSRRRCRRAWQFADRCSRPRPGRLWMAGSDARFPANLFDFAGIHHCGRRFALSRFAFRHFRALCSIVFSDFWRRWPSRSPLGAATISTSAGGTAAASCAPSPPMLTMLLGGLCTAPTGLCRLVRLHASTRAERWIRRRPFHCDPSARGAGACALTYSLSPTWVSSGRNSGPLPDSPHVRFAGSRGLLPTFTCSVRRMSPASSPSG